MPTVTASPPPSRLVLLALVAMILGIGGTAAVGWSLGAFRDPELTRVHSPARRLAYVEHIGSYRDLKGAFAAVDEALRGAGFSNLEAAAEFLDDPAHTPVEKLRSRVGYLVPLDASLPPGIPSGEIPPRETLRARFVGSPVLGSYKSYRAMKQWCDQYRMEPLLPSLEIYGAGAGQVVYELPVSERPPSGR
jgi:hypothetical protein